MEKLRDTPEVTQSWGGDAILIYLSDSTSRVLPTHPPLSGPMEQPKVSETGPALVPTCACACGVTTLDLKEQKPVSKSAETTAHHPLATMSECIPHLPDSLDGLSLSEDSGLPDHLCLNPGLSGLGTQGPACKFPERRLIDRPCSGITDWPRCPDRAGTRDAPCV
jgi:hypothetical protein